MDFSSLFENSKRHFLSTEWFWNEETKKSTMKNLNGWNWSHKSTLKSFLWRYLFLSFSWTCSFSSAKWVKWGIFQVLYAKEHESTLSGMVRLKLISFVLKSWNFCSSLMPCEKRSFVGRWSLVATFHKMKSSYFFLSSEALHNSIRWHPI